jgi:hypothetical protein
VTAKKKRKKHYNHVYRLRQRYGLTVDDYNKMLKAQGGVCAICSGPPAPFGPHKLMRLAVDHCHTTGRIRGLLCPRCNQALGLMRDNPVFLLKATEYLRKTDEGRSTAN